MRQRGFSGIEFLIYAAVALAVIGAVWGAIAWHANTHYQRGMNEKQVEWDQAKAKSIEDAKARDAHVDAQLADSRKWALAAEAEAEKSKRQLAEERRRAKRDGTRLAACVEEPRASGGGDEPGSGGGRGLTVPASPAAGDHPRGSALRLRVTYEFVRQYDGAWTGIDGKPVSQALAGDQRPERASLSPYGPEDILDVHIANAEACSRDRRSLAELINRVERAAMAWEKP